MQDIEQTIIELGDIFSQLATMVREQEELIDMYMTEFKTCLYAGQISFFFLI
jgi:t-SNARE complex subunit (syntaxin)